MPQSPFLGELMIFAGNFAPFGWALCAGQTLAINQNQALFSLLGTTYGGNGTTTFALPDLRGRLPLHEGQGPGLSAYALGDVTGTENETVSIGQMPPHIHPVKAVANGQSNGSNVPSASVMLASAYAVQAGNAFVPIYSSAAPSVTMAPNAVGATGSGLPHSNIMPVLALNWCIALLGIFPSRN